MAADSLGSLVGGPAACTALVGRLGYSTGAVMQKKGGPIEPPTWYILPPPFTGGIDARPLDAQIRSKVGESWARAWSTMGLMRRMGWCCGTRASGVIAVGTVACRAALPGKPSLTADDPILPPAAHLTPIFNTLLREPESNGQSVGRFRWSRLPCPPSAAFSVRAGSGRASIPSVPADRRTALRSMLLNFEEGGAPGVQVLGLRCWNRILSSPTAWPLPVLCSRLWTPR